jgi:hypothetical protein
MLLNPVSSAYETIWVTRNSIILARVNKVRPSAVHASVLSQKPKLREVPGGTQ